MCLLGPVEVHGAGPAAMTQPRLRALVGVLALSANKVVPDRALVEAIWSEEVSRQRLADLRVLVYQLRRRLGDVEPGRTASRVTTAPPGYRLALAADELDVSRFELLALRGRKSASDGDHAAASCLFRQALGLWRGPPLADVAAGSVLAGEAARLDELRLAALECRFASELALGLHGELTAELTALASENPLRERLTEQLMLALCGCGRQAEALAVYRKAWRVLNAELGIAPGLALTRLHQRILDGDQTLVGPQITVEAKAGASALVPRQLPLALSHFSGRAAELEQLDDLAGRVRGSRATVVVATISGMAGIGKTSLAVHWAHRVASQFSAGQLYANLRGYDAEGSAVAPDEVLRGFLDALGVAPERVPDGRDARAALYRTLLADRRMLIVLDNARDAAQVRPLLPAGPGSMVIVTSRTGLPGLSASDGAVPIDLGLPSGGEAHQLLAALLTEQRLAAEPAAASELITLCARLPLAISIVASRAVSARGKSLAALAADLSGERIRLDVFDTGDAATSVRAVFSWSYGRLTGQAARAFRLLASQPGPDISLAAAASVMPLPKAVARLALAELTDARLLSEHSPGRYAFHDLVQAYAAELAMATDTTNGLQAAAVRALDHYLHTGHAAARLLEPTHRPLDLPDPAAGVLPERIDDRADAMAWFKAEHHVLLANITRAADRGLDSYAWRIPWTLRNYLDWQGHWDDFAFVNEIALAAARREGDDFGLAWTYHRMATVSLRRGRYDEAIGHADQALQGFCRVGDLLGQAHAHLSTSWIHGLRGRFDGALEHACQAMLMYGQAGERCQEAAAMTEVGWYHTNLGNLELGLDYCRRALDAHRRAGSPQSRLAHAWDRLGFAHERLGDNIAATSCYGEALMLFRDLGHTWGQANSLFRLGFNYEAAADLAAARLAWQQALDLLGDMHHPAASRARARLGVLVAASSTSCSPGPVRKAA